MGTLRTFLREHGRLAWLLVVMTLALKAAMPAGYMIGMSGTVLTVEICADASGQRVTRQIVVPHDGSNAGGMTEHPSADGTCPWSVMSLAGLESVDPGLQALSLGFILLLGFAPVSVPSLSGSLHLRPPLRGPPVFA